MILLVTGCIYLLIGISDRRDAQQIDKHGITVAAAVKQNQGWGKYSVRVGYVTVTGRREQGTLDTPGLSTSYAIGSRFTVIYDPSDPSVVALAGSAGDDGWPEIGIGGFLIGVIAVTAVLILLRTRHARNAGS